MLLSQPDIPVMKVSSASPAMRFAIIAICSLCFFPAHAKIITGRVVKIADGDTLTVLDRLNRQHKVRLIGIDAPERKQPFSTISRQHLANLVFGKKVRVEWYKRDHYQRVLGKVLLNGQDINLEQLKAGLAWHYKQYQGDQLRGDRGLYAKAQKHASLKGIGLWSDSSPVAPWDFRRRKRAIAADEVCEITLAGVRYKIEPLCWIRNVLRSTFTISELMDFVRLAVRRLRSEVN
jgi:endonuclease YncB( thermonuclease family)